MYLMEIFLTSSNEREWGLPRWPSGKEAACQARDIGDTGSIPSPKDPLEEEMATHSSILAHRTPWTEESGRLNWSHKELETT